MINRAEGGDRFLPLNFETRTKGIGAVDSTVDLFSEAFGVRSDLTQALGSYGKAAKAYTPLSLDKLDENGNAMFLQ